MYKRMDDMDVNCGTILDGEESVQSAAARLRPDTEDRLGPAKPRRALTSAARFAPRVLGATM
jgi:altronate hydrolase